jgi:hypothetical protein
VAALDLTRTIPPRICPACHELHPPLRTCAGGGNPWTGEPVTVSYTVKAGPPPVVRLSAEELVLADRYADERVENHQETGSSDRAGLVLDEEARHALDLDGVLGEMAVASWLQVPYVHSKGAFRIPDVGPAHVRSTRYRTGSLIYRPGDPEGAYVLVVDRRPEFVIPGWLPSHVCRGFPLRRPDRSRPATHLIAQNHLRALPGGVAGIRALQEP